MFHMCHFCTRNNLNKLRVVFPNTTNQKGTIISPLGFFSKTTLKADNSTEYQEIPYSEQASVAAEEHPLKHISTTKVRTTTT